MYPRAFNHVGISVTDINQAVDFYTRALGCYLLVEPTTVSESQSTHLTQILTQALGPGWGEVKMAHLSTVDGIGVELFEFKGAQRVQAPDRYRQTGIFHLCVQDPNVEGLARTIVAYGGKQRMPVQTFYPGEKPYKMVYCEDPFGNIIEIYSHEYALTWSPRAYAARAARA